LSDGADELAAGDVPVAAGVVPPLLHAVRVRAAVVAAMTIFITCRTVSPSGMSDADAASTGVTLVLAETRHYRVG
jgi:hypothetical protein